MKILATKISGELAVQTDQVAAAIGLLDGGATVPFIARYRKEATGGLDDAQLRALSERLDYLRGLEDRRASILKIIRDQDRLTPELEREILNAETKTRLEDIYLPYRPKRRTKAQMAREAGLEPLAQALLERPETEPERQADVYVSPSKGVDTVSAALEGARQILMERFAEDASLVGELREYLWENALLGSRVAAGKEDEGAKFADYFDYQEPIKKVPSHRALALYRGRNEGILHLELRLPDHPSGSNQCEGRIARHFGIRYEGRAGDGWLETTVRWTWRVKLLTKLEPELQARLRTRSEQEAIRVFAHNLHDLLLAAPAGPRTVMGLDPGLRTGVKVAVVDRTGKVLETGTVYPHEPRRQRAEAIDRLGELVRNHGVDLIAVGNGTASRETDRLVSELIGRNPKKGVHKLMVSEAGASVYSASSLASSELPDLDVSLRGAVSIARRVQDPLAELVKIDPRSIGVGQYQHDVNQGNLARALDAVVEDCVNAVGVDVNTASVSLLARVAGIGSGVAQRIVAHRDAEGPFRDRETLKKVPRLGPKVFEQAAGFLRVRDGSNPLDASGVHPEAYPVVERISVICNRSPGQLIGDGELLRSLSPANFTDRHFGIPTVADILAELEKPGRDPRPDFKTLSFKEGIERMSDLIPGMLLDGVVTNVANFGAFVDLGVHQDGLVHVSRLADRFVRDPREVVKAGDVVRVKVLEVDQKRRRISLTMRLGDATEASRAGRQVAGEGSPAGRVRRHQGPAVADTAASHTGRRSNAMAEAFARGRHKGGHR